MGTEGLSSGQNVHKAIKNTSPDGYTFYIGRTNAHHTWHVGKVTLQHKVLYYGHNMLTQKTATYEVLICNKITPAISETTTTTQIISTAKPDKSSNNLISLNIHNTELGNQLRAANLDNKGLRDDLAVLRTKLMAKVHENARLQEQLNKCETRDFV